MKRRRRGYTYYASRERDERRRVGQSEIWKVLNRKLVISNVTTINGCLCTLSDFTRF
jgi:hypothetical protein